MLEKIEKHDKRNARMLYLRNTHLERPTDLHSIKAIHWIVNIN